MLLFSCSAQLKDRSVLDISSPTLPRREWFDANGDLSMEMMMEFDGY